MRFASRIWPNKLLRLSFNAVGLLWLWTALGFVAAFSFLAIVPARISLNAPAMSFVDYLSQAEWRDILADGESAVAFLLLVVATLLIVSYSITRSALRRLCIVLFVLLAPAIAFTDNASEFGLWFLKMPYMAVGCTFQALRGQGNGQFYTDGPFLLAAIGWWTAFCLVLVCREGLVWWRRWTVHSHVFGVGGSAG